MLLFYLGLETLLLLPLLEKKRPLLVHFEFEGGVLLVKLVELLLESGIVSLGLLQELLVLSLDLVKEGDVVVSRLDPLSQEVRVVLRRRSQCLHGWLMLLGLWRLLHRLLYLR